MIDQGGTTVVVLGEVTEPNIGVPVKAIAIVTHELIGAVLEGTILGVQQSNHLAQIKMAEKQRTSILLPGKSN